MSSSTTSAGAELAVVACATCCCTELSLVAGWSTTLIWCWEALNCATRLAAAAAERGSNDSTTVTTVGVGVLAGSFTVQVGGVAPGATPSMVRSRLGVELLQAPSSRATAVTAATEGQVRRDMIRQI